MDNRNSRISIRPATPADLDVLRDIFYKSICESTVNEYNPEQVAAWASGYGDAGRWQKRLREQYFIVAENDGTLFGFASLTEDARLDFLYVHPDHQRKGIATLLLKAIEKKAREWDIGELQTFASLTAVPFFEAMGFIQVAEQSVDIRGILLRNYHMKRIL